jgi:hypothetical protein
MARKTINVTDLIETINTSIAISTCSAETRQGMMNVLEGVLHSTGNYRGFRYLTQDEVPVGEKPGINCFKSETENTYESRFLNTDRTRVQYFG